MEFYCEWVELVFALRHLGNCVLDVWRKGSAAYLQMAGSEFHRKLVEFYRLVQQIFCVFLARDSSLFDTPDEPTLLTSSGSQPGEGTGKTTCGCIDRCSYTPQWTQPFEEVLPSVTLMSLNSESYKSA